MLARSNREASPRTRGKEWTSRALGSTWEARALPVYDEVHVKRTPTMRRHSGLNCVVQSAPPVHSSTGENSGPLQDAKGIAIDGEHVAPEAVEKDAARRLPRKTREARKEPLGVLVAHCSHQV